MDIKAVVKDCQNGSKDAFGILYQTFSLSMEGVIGYYIHDNGLVQDILHDGFIVAFTSIRNLKDATKIKSWLTTIMKNLALQYLKEESTLLSISLSDDSAAINTEEDNSIHSELTWEELNRIIDKLPEGYGKVFRLAVFDGLSHREIGELLGIAPHSSSSQLTHAKAMLRRMITNYRIEMGILSIAAIILLVWNGIFNNRGNTASSPVISKTTDKTTSAVIDSTYDDVTKNVSVIPRFKTIYKISSTGIQEHIAEVTLQSDSTPVVHNDCVASDTITIIPSIIDKTELIAQEDLPRTLFADNHDWSLSMAYSGVLEQNDHNRYRIPNPDLPDEEGPSGEIEVTEKTHHYMPLVIGLSVNKSLTSHWCIETGLRYTFLRSDFLSESELMNKNTIQCIHYIGVPLKFNYRVFTYNGLSLYGHGGGALDIPVYGAQSIWECSPKLGTASTDVFHIYAPLQWSVEGGVGIQYHFTPAFSIYAEPSLRYYFNPGTNIKTIRQEKPFEFTIPIGLRFTW